MATSLRKWFGDRLITKQFDESETVLPSPNDLIGKVIVKGKKLKANDDDGEVSEEDESKDAEKENRSAKSGKKRKKVEPSLSRMMAHSKQDSESSRDWALEGATIQNAAFLESNQSECRIFGRIQSECLFPKLKRSDWWRPREIPIPGIKPNRDRAPISLSKRVHEQYCVQH